MITDRREYTHRNKRLMITDHYICATCGRSSSSFARFWAHLRRCG